MFDCCTTPPSPFAIPPPLRGEPYACVTGVFASSVSVAHGPGGNGHLGTVTWPKKHRK